MQRQQAYNIVGTNIENLDSELATKCRRTSAACEQEWHKAGQGTGLLIWRIENFQVKPWPNELYGQFYNGDSYIVLYTYGNAPHYSYDVHFWLGSETSVDEAGTACYKTVELDTYLEGVPVQHREVEGYESSRFLSYFPTGIRILTGGVESGFHHVKPEEYRPRLLHVKGRFSHVCVKEVPLARASLNSGDVFILDAGLTLYQFNGAQSNAGERVKAGQLCRAIDEERAGKPRVAVLEEAGEMRGEDFDKFWELLGGRGSIASADAGGSDAESARQGTGKKLFRLSDASGRLTFTEVGSGLIRKSMLNDNDVFILDTGAELFVWIGRGASREEKAKGMSFAQDYIRNQNRPAYLPITRILQGGENEIWESSFDG